MVMQEFQIDTQKESSSESCHLSVVAIVRVKIGCAVYHYHSPFPDFLLPGSAFQPICKFIALTGLIMSPHSLPQNPAEEALSCPQESLRCSHSPSPHFLIMPVHGSHAHLADAVHAGPPCSPGPPRLLSPLSESGSSSHLECVLAPCRSPF